MNLSKFHTDLRFSSSLALDVKAEGDGRIAGYASTFAGAPDRHGDIVSAGAFSRTLKEHRAEGTMPAMLWAHQLEEPIGRWLRVEEDSKGLFVSGQLNLKTARGRDAYEHVRAGDVTGFSIGFVTPENGRRYFGKGAFALDEVDLVEISVVSVPANTRARIAGVKHIGSKAEAVTFLRDAGLSKTAAQRFAAGGFPALVGDDGAEERIRKFAAQIERATLQLRKS
ncbi:HK97 family phage prohead protease [Cereibacter sphaeroides]|nr:HK97 family phage prohead protease [Cereibacter sphaeroides]